MGAKEYQLLKCEDCGKTLGYIYIKLRKGFLSPVYLSTRYWPLAVQGPQDFEKTVFCETCFQKRVEEISKGKQETTINKDESQEPRNKSRDRQLVR
jgi:hypothetical protein